MNDGFESDYVFYDKEEAIEDGIENLKRRGNGSYRLDVVKRLANEDEDYYGEEECVYSAISKNGRIIKEFDYD